MISLDVGMSRHEREHKMPTLKLLPSLYLFVSF